MVWRVCIAPASSLRCALPGFTWDRSARYEGLPARASLVRSDVKKQVPRGRTLEPLLTRRAMALESQKVRHPMLARSRGRLLRRKERASSCLGVALLLSVSACDDTAADGDGGLDGGQQPSVGADAAVGDAGSSSSTSDA